MTKLSELHITPHFSKYLPADANTENRPRQVEGACYSFVDPKSPSDPKYIHHSSALAEELDLKIEQHEVVQLLSGVNPFNTSDFQSFAMCYGGHQFGHWAGQLGDGRAIIIGETNIKNQLYQIQLKGAGTTPYSRGADGFAVLRSSIREYLCSEAMYFLGVPTTRALSLVTTGDLVNRDILYNGNPQLEKGAIVCRIAPSFIRFGNFEIFAARRDEATLKALVDYTINWHYPHLGVPSKETYLRFFEEVSQRTKDLMIHWQRVGFVHGVMNTDNLSIHGITIDYGPYGWLEDYDPDWTPNTTDREGRRYRFGNQPNIGLWNLVQLANALYSLVNEAKPFESILEDYKSSFYRDYKKMMLEKLGLYDQDIPQTFVAYTEEILKKLELDYILFFRKLSIEDISLELFKNILIESSYLSKDQIQDQSEYWTDWFETFTNYLTQENTGSRAERMTKVNPKYVLRNYMAQLAIDEADKENYQLIDELYQLLLKPYDEQPEHEKWFAKRPDWAKHKIGCSMLSCSS